MNDDPVLGAELNDFDVAEGDMTITCLGLLAVYPFAAANELLGP